MLEGEKKANGVSREGVLGGVGRAGRVTGLSWEQG